MTRVRHVVKLSGGSFVQMLKSVTRLCWRRSVNNKVTPSTSYLQLLSKNISPDSCKMFGIVKDDKVLVENSFRYERLQSFVSAAYL